MFKAKSSCEIKIGEVTYQVICDSDAQINQLIDVLNIVIKNAQKMLDDASKPSEEQYEAVEGVVEQV
jgi:hypothetical protein